MNIPSRHEAQQRAPKYLFFLVLGLVAVLFLMVLKRLRATNYKLLKGGLS